jgi:hypothetical protein
VVDVDVGSFFIILLIMYRTRMPSSPAMEDELPVNPYIDARPEVPGAVTYLREWEARSTSGHKPRLGHYEVVQYNIPGCEARNRENT